MKWNLGIKIGTGYAVALLALLIISVISFRSINHLVETAKMAAHTNEVLEKISFITFFSPGC